MSIFITGDTHGDFDIEKLSLKNFPEQEELTKDDYLIVAGDFGAVWDGGEKDEKLLDRSRLRPGRSYRRGSY